MTIRKIFRYTTRTITKSWFSYNKKCSYSVSKSLLLQHRYQNQNVAIQKEFLDQV